MNWELKLITLFVYICKPYDAFLWVYRQRQSPNDQPVFSDSEGIVVYLWAVMQGHRKLKTIYHYTRDHLAPWFPALPSYKNFVVRLNRLNGVFVPLFAQIQADFPQRPGLKQVTAFIRASCFSQEANDQNRPSPLLKHQRGLKNFCLPFVFFCNSFQEIALG